MRVVWDLQKNEINIQKHGFDFAAAFRLFARPILVDRDNREDYGEDRWVGIGILDGREVVIVFTEPDDETVRVISLRKALRHEQRRFHRYIENGLEED